MPIAPVVNHELSRPLVTRGRKQPFSRWFKYKEAFSADLVRSLLDQFLIDGRVLDPFAGSGTAVYTAAGLGQKALGIELLPVGIALAHAREAAGRVDPDEFKDLAAGFIDQMFQTEPEPAFRFPHVRITKGAFSETTEQDIARYRTWMQGLSSEMFTLFNVAGMCALEDASYTTKDGQFLRWDHRSGKTRSDFQKRYVREFHQAVLERLVMIHEDLAHVERTDDATMLQGSCFDWLPKLHRDQFQAVITSPPYCNRYDYTRTYALELAWLGESDNNIKALRQQLLSCTVENRPKDLGNPAGHVRCALNENRTFTQMMDGLRAAKLPNPNVLTMVENYCVESGVMLYEIRRVLESGGGVAIVVNDNVQYAGIEVPVDTIYTRLAEVVGLQLRHHWILPKGKGNSSQQMAVHGRRELRKSVLVWEKP